MARRISEAQDEGGMSYADAQAALRQIAELQLRALGRSGVLAPAQCASLLAQNSQYFGDDADDDDDDDDSLAPRFSLPAALSASASDGAPARRLVDEHDAVFFAGDLNYRLDHVSKDLCERLLEIAGLTRGGAAEEAATFSHRAQGAEWTPYAPAQNTLIAAAIANSPEGGALPLPGIPFEVRWGSSATSERCHAPPPTASLHVRTEHERPRRVPRDPRLRHDLESLHPQDEPFGTRLTDLHRTEEEGAGC